MLVLTASPLCGADDVFRVDGDTVTKTDIRLFQKLESKTGLRHTVTSATLGALERRGQVAVAKRLGLAVTQATAHARMKTHLEKVADPRKIGTVIKAIGRDAYRRWFMQPKIAETDLRAYYLREIPRWGRKRAIVLLKRILTGQVSVEALRTQAAPGILYARFRLMPRDIIHHYAKGQRDDYLERLEAYRSGRSKIRPATPQSAVEDVPGLGYGNRGYVAQMAEVLASLKDGEWSRDVVRDQHQWLLLRRLAHQDHVFEGDGFRIPIIEFHNWLVSRYGELEIKLCSPDFLPKARQLAPKNPFVELLQ